MVTSLIVAMICATFIFGPIIIDKIWRSSDDKQTAHAVWVVAMLAFVSEAVSVNL